MKITGNFATFLVESVGICSNNLITSLKFGLKLFKNFQLIFWNWDRYKTTVSYKSIFSKNMLSDQMLSHQTCYR